MSLNDTQGKDVTRRLQHKRADAAGRKCGSFNWNERSLRPYPFPSAQRIRIAMPAETADAWRWTGMTLAGGTARSIKTAR